MRFTTFAFATLASTLAVCGSALAGTTGYQFEPISPLPVAAGHHSATLLPSGQVLVAGGLIYEGETGVSTLYDPATRRFTTTGSMLEARGGHRAVRLASGAVLAVGGSAAGASTGSAERYDPATGTWSATGSLATPRSGHTVTLLADGNVLAVGGNNFQAGSGNVTESVERYDAAAGTWSAAASLPAARMSHAAERLGNGKVLVVGGYSPDTNTALATALLYDPATNTWTAAASMPQARLGPTATLLASGEVLVVGGAPEPFMPGLASAVIYDPATNTWRAGGDLANERSGHSATLLPSGKVLVVAGFGMFSPAPRSAELYDPATNTWTEQPTLGTFRFEHTATALASGEVLVAGGQMPVSATAFTDTVELFTNLGRPIANITAPPLDFTLTAGTSTAGTITVANDGPPAMTLNYAVTETSAECTDASDIAWLRATPVQGAVAGAASTPVTVTVDAAGLAPGVYVASLCIGTDDLVDPRTMLPVRLVVDAAADTLFRGGFEAVTFFRDPSFEVTHYTTPAWTGTDSQGGPGATPFFSGAGSGARSGYGFVQFGMRFGDTLTQTATQTFTMPAGGVARLTYWRKIPFLPEGTATLTISIDGTPVQAIDVTAEPSGFDYERQSVNIGAYADGASHTIELRYDYTVDEGGFASDGWIVIDDIAIETGPAP
jgi:N-acetylneuraminic acid mutarotase